MEVLPCVLEVCVVRNLGLLGHNAEGQVTLHFGVNEGHLDLTWFQNIVELCVQVGCHIHKQTHNLRVHPLALAPILNHLLAPRRIVILILIRAIFHLVS